MRDQLRASSVDLRMQPVVPAANVKPYRQSALADGVVRFAGEPLAVVVARDAYAASDGADAVMLSAEGPSSLESHPIMLEVNFFDEVRRRASE